MIETGVVQETYWGTTCTLVSSGRSKTALPAASWCSASLCSPPAFSPPFFSPHACPPSTSSPAIVLPYPSSTEEDPADSLELRRSSKVLSEVPSFSAPPPIWPRTASMTASGPCATVWTAVLGAAAIRLSVPQAPCSMRSTHRPEKSTNPCRTSKD